ncbi:Aldehyde dehydrogenase family 2 member B4, mitochondrial [Hordeum vulgare]|nr:Aldehyde dehydrogenase family 2 member B4, mitochondrial [Hordeum vulgare]
MTFYRSTTDNHDGWVFYKCKKHNRWELEYVQHLIETRVLVGNAVVDALGTAQDKREELEMKRNEENAGRRGIAGRGNACRVNFGSLIDKNFATKSNKLLCCLN